MAIGIKKDALLSVKEGLDSSLESLLVHEDLNLLENEENVSEDKLLEIYYGGGIRYDAVDPNDVIDHENEKVFRITLSCPIEDGGENLYFECGGDSQVLTNRRVWVKASELKAGDLLFDQTAIQENVANGIIPIESVEELEGTHTIHTFKTWDKQCSHVFVRGFLVHL